MEKNKIFLDKNCLENEIMNFSTLFANGPGNGQLIKNQFRGLRSKKSSSIMLPRGYVLKRREIFFIIIFLIFLLIGGCGGSGGDGGGSSGGTMSLAWDAPTTKADGSPLSDLKGYWIYYGTSTGVYTERTYAGNVTTYTLTGLTPGQTYYIAVTAIDASDNESNLSNEVSGAAK
jgi:hypothetical protein